jgi:site-specific recombinase XerD
MKTTKSTFSAGFVAQKGKPKADGTIPILARIIINGEMAHFSTKFHIQPDRWLTREGRTVGLTHEEKQINLWLGDFWSLIRQRYNEIVMQGEVATADRVKQAVLKLDQRGVKILDLFDDFNADYLKMVNKGTTHKTYTRYLLTRNLLADFISERHKRKDMVVAEINSKFVNDFFVWLRNHDTNSHNYHMKFIQRFRTVFNVARNNGWVQGDPFASFKMRFEEIDRGYLTKAELETLMTKSMPSVRMERVRDLFVFSCFCGLAYVDVKELSATDIVRGDDGNLWIDTRRIKTGAQVNVPLLKVPLAIIQKYSGVGRNGKLFNVPSNQKVNDYLKEIAAICGIDKRVTYHLARHTFSTTVTLSNGVPLETVSKMLGHKNIRTTQIYARMTKDRISNDMNALARILDGGQQAVAV